MSWIKQHPWKSGLGVVAVALLLVSATSLLEFKSDNALYNQLMAIMRGEMPEEGPAFAKNLTDVVCPLVTEEKLDELLADVFIARKMEFTSYNARGRHPDFPDRPWGLEPVILKEWVIIRSTWLIANTHFYITLGPDGYCEGFIQRPEYTL